MKATHNFFARDMRVVYLEFSLGRQQARQSHNQMLLKVQSTYLLTYLLTNSTTVILSILSAADVRFSFLERVQKVRLGLLHVNIISVILHGRQNVLSLATASQKDVKRSKVVCSGTAEM